MRHEKWRQRFGLTTMLLATGLLGGLLTPIQSEAQTKPTLTIDNVAVTDLQSVPCPTGYTSCWLIPNASGTPGRRIGNWYVRDEASTNRAIVYINDQGTSGSVDKMRFSGVRLTPVDTQSTTKSTTVVITHKYSNAQVSGNYVWAVGAGAYFDPLPTENVVGNRLRLVGNGVFVAGTSDALGTLDTGTYTSSTLNDRNTSSTTDLPSKIVKSGCSGSSCAPEITYQFQIDVKGGDSLVLKDSLIGAGGVCREEGPVPTVPPGTPDPLPPGPVCKGFMSQVNQVVHRDLMDSLKSAKLDGAVPAETCPGSCGNGTIIITKTVFEGDPDGTFGFSAIGEDISPVFDITTSSGTGTRTFSNVATDAAGGVRTITETVFPPTDKDHYWTLEDVSCTNAGGLENGTSWEKHYQFCDEYGCYGLDGVTVNNLVNGDTLNCTFQNNRSLSD